MSDHNRVFITGLSAVTASGMNIDDNWNAILASESAIDEIQQWDLSSWTHRLGGELKAYQPAKMLPDKKLMKSISRQDVIGIHAAMQAVDHSQLLDYRQTLESTDSFNEDTAVFVGSPGNKFYQQYDFLPLLAKTNGDMHQFATQLTNEVHPTWLLRILPNNVLAYTGITYGFKGVNHNIANHAVGGMQAIIEAYQCIKSGQAERAVVVAYDVGIEPQALFYYEKLGVLSASHLRPFDISQDGTIMGEGAAAIVLESERSVLARNAVCYAEIMSGRSSTEASGLFSIEEDGQHLVDFLRTTLEKCDVSARDIGILVAHGNGNQKSDLSEALAYQAVFGDYAVPITAFKWAMGHTICASGVLDTVLASYCLREQLVPGVLDFNVAAPGCEQLNIDAQTRPLMKNKPYAMVVNRGFASMNACLVIKSCE
jgi:3-oxoacyl-[acyl-carrier-protein] synthase-1